MLFVHFVHRVVLDGEQHKPLMVFLKDRFRHLGAFEGGIALHVRYNLDI